MLVVFDLDGTLIDSAQDLAISMNATREHLELTPLDPQLIYSFVGNGAPTLVRRALGPDAGEDLNKRALDYFLKYYRAHALEHTRLYEGMREVLDEMLAKGHDMAVLTNKPVKISRDILMALGLEKHFHHVYGGDSFATKKPDPEGLLTIVEAMNAPTTGAWMVGDSGVDIQTARNAGVRSCGVRWGFQPEACASENPDAMIDKPAQLFQVLE